MYRSLYCWISCFTEGNLRVQHNKLSINCSQIYKFEALDNFTICCFFAPKICTSSHSSQMFLPIIHPLLCHQAIKRSMKKKFSLKINKQNFSCRYHWSRGWLGSQPSMHICKQKNKMLRLIGNISFLIKEKKRQIM